MVSVISFNTEMSGAALGPVLEKEMGKERVAYHLTADYTWGWSQEGSIKKYTEALGWKTQEAVTYTAWVQVTSHSTSRRY